MIRRLIILASILCVFPTVLQAGERELSKKLCDHLGGEAEARSPEGQRADCVTDEYAIEVEYSQKWKDGIGQSLTYGMLFERKPKIILVCIEGKKLEACEKHLERLDAVVRTYNLPISTQLIAESEITSQP